MALDNPSYFTIASASEPTSLFVDQKMGAAASATDNISTSSECSLSRKLTPPRNAYQNKPAMLNLARSMSANSADSNPDLLIMGEPRLSDIAPELAFKYPGVSDLPKRTNSLKKRSELQCHDLMYFAVPAPEDGAVAAGSGDEEVFLSEDSARYYNFAAISENRRRHSISTFTTRERSTSVASASSKGFKEDPPQAVIHATADGEAVGPFSSVTIDDHSIRHGSYPRRRCNRCIRKPILKRGDMDDILIISVKHSSAATLWVDYFNSYFQHICKQTNRKPFKIYHLGVEEIMESRANVSLMQERASGVKLQLIVVCPNMLELISWNPTSASVIGHLVIPDRALALLLGVSDEDLTDVHKTALATYPQWQRLSVGLDQDENFTKGFLGNAVSILSRVWKQQQTTAYQHPKAQFSVSPKKVQQGHSSVVIMLTHPLQREDIIKVLIERNDEIIEVKSVKRRNPYTLKITVPESCIEVSAIVHILVEKNGSIIGSSRIKCENRLGELENILRSSENPLEFMCQALGFSPANREHMDSCILYSFQKNMPPNFNLTFDRPYGGYGSSIYAQREGQQEYPTLLHFAAAYGLEKLAVHLLDCPGGDVACDIRNSYDFTPDELAYEAGFKDLAHILRGYMKMNEVKTVYEKLKEMSLQSKTPDVEEDETGYLTPRQLDAATYKRCPTPKPFNPSFPNYEEPSSGYMSMSSVQAKANIEPQLEPSLAAKQKTTINHETSSSLQKDVHETALPTTTINTPKTLDLCEDKVQKELLEIINDFKNNVHSISQVETLVEEWKNRNDVQKSFKEKQEQLNEMRLRYDRIQQEIKNSTKKTTPFERVKKLFFKGKAQKEEIKIDTPTLTSSTLHTPTSSISFSSQSQRPISSLSLQSTSSSGSSGRMSTISGCSMGDSGTHSDHEERKTILTNSTDDEFRIELNKAIINLNYTVPPPPRPFNPVKMIKHKTFATIEERPPQPVPRPSTDDDLYYIEFPPSGLPVQDFTNPNGTNRLSPKPDDQGHSRNVSQMKPDYMNLQPIGLPTSSEETDLHEYMNFSSKTTNVNKTA